jgi:glucose/arabinose dehydrogenase/plastocyanin
MHGRIGLGGVVLIAALGAPASAHNHDDDPLPRVPPGFAVTPYAHIGGLNTSLNFGSDTRDAYEEGERLYATDFAGGRVLAIDDVAGLGQVSVFAEGFRNPLGVVAADDGTVFVADAEASRDGPFGNRTYGRIWRVQDTTGDGAADRMEVVLKDLPNGRHNTNGMQIGPDGMLYVTNGNSTDDGVEGGAPEVLPWTGAVIRIDPDATDVSLADIAADEEWAQEALAATGMRNLFDLTFSPVDPALLFIPTNGSDDPPSDDLLYATRVQEEDEDGELQPTTVDYGFPSCLYNELERGDLEPFDNPGDGVIDQFGPCPTDTVPRPLAGFGLHVSANGLDFQRTDAWGDDYRNNLFVAQFGNFFGERPRGRRVMRVEMDSSGTQVERIRPFLTGTAPLGLTFGSDGRLFVGDFSGVIYAIDRVAEVPDTVDVVVSNYQFTPQALVVPEGTTVRWINDDVFGLPHVVVSQASVRTDGTVGEGSEINSPTLGVGDSHEYRFDRAGTWKYWCTIDPAHQAAMHATVTVVPAGG